MPNQPFLRFVGLEVCPTFPQPLWTSALQLPTTQHAIPACLSVIYPPYSSTKQEMSTSIHRIDPHTRGGSIAGAPVINVSLIDQSDQWMVWMVWTVRGCRGRPTTTRASPRSVELLQKQFVVVGE